MVETTKEKIIIAGDHKGFEMKKELISYLTQLGFEAVDLGPYSHDRVDYPMYASAVAEKISRGEYKRGIVICYTGIGTSIVANKIPGVRAALVMDEDIAELTRKHNDSNVLALAAGFTSVDKAKKILKKWLFTEAEGGRHQLRVEQINQIERDVMRDVKKMGKGDVKITASLMCADKLNLLKDVNNLAAAGIDLLHVDIIDGNFVKNTSMNVGHVSALRSNTNLPIEAHLMVTDPSSFIPRLATAGTDIVFVHVEIEGDLNKILEDIKSNGMRAGLVIKVETPIDALYPYLEKVDVVMFMCAETGFKSRPFVPSVLDKIRSFKDYVEKKNLNIVLQADGCVGPKTISSLYKAGARIFVGGTAGLFRGKDFEKNIRLLRSLCH